MGFLKQFFKIKKSKNTEHPCTFMQSYMNTIYCLNNLFDYNVQLKLTAFFHYPSTSLGRSLWKPAQNVQKFNKGRYKCNSNFTHARLLKGLLKTCYIWPFGFVDTNLFFLDFQQRFSYSKLQYVHVQHLISNKAI